MIPRETIQKILEAGVQAPSGENAQQWRFELQGNEIWLFNVPERDLSLYNFRQRASYIAHGAVIENMVIAASHYGFAASIEVFPDKNNMDLVARIALKESAPAQEPLYPFIPTRATNRKPYKKDMPIAPEVIDSLISAAQSIAGPAVAFTSDAAKIAAIAEASSVNDRLLLENRSLHDFFFEHVHWTEEEEKKLMLGFYIEVLELPPPVKAMFRLFQHWPIMRVLNALGVAKAGSKQNIALYASAPAVGMLAIRDDAPERFVETGRALQRVWLTATSKGLSMQPLVGVLFFNQRVEAGDASQFSWVHIDCIRRAYDTIRSTFGIKDGMISMMFRVGYADPPTAHSLKLPPIIKER